MATYEQEQAERKAYLAEQSREWRTYDVEQYKDDPLRPWYGLIAYSGTEWSPSERKKMIGEFKTRDEAVAEAKSLGLKYRFATGG